MELLPAVRFELTKHYALELETSPFDRSGMLVILFTIVNYCISIFGHIYIFLILFKLFFNTFYYINGSIK